ncbi:MAG: FtsH protease regulator HflK [Pelotomaculum sp. PtaU1.Bin035]|nr:MAG: FtsH protease regulator HflK [Pelotomaculum sp. PtaU1.Bin035]
MNSNRKVQTPEARVNSVAVLLFVLIAVIGFIVGSSLNSLLISGIFIIVAALIAFSVKIARQWEKAVILRLGKFKGLAGPGLFLVIPVIDSVSSWIDHRIIADPFNAEQTLTKDTVPVDVDAVLFWMVRDAEKAALEVERYKEAVSWAAQTALRDIIGKTLLSEMLAGRDQIDEELKKVIDERTEPWGISVRSVEIRDVIIPSNLQDAMSREAQAERERKARIILGTAETEIAEKFAEAAKTYENSPVGLQLRAMNILYEGLKEKGALVVVPSSVVETMGLGTISGLSAMARYHPPRGAGR